MKKVIIACLLDFVDWVLRKMLVGKYDKVQYDKGYFTGGLRLSIEERLTKNKI